MTPARLTDGGTTPSAGTAEARWYGCESCHANQPPATSYANAPCHSCGERTVVEVAPVAPNLTRARERQDTTTQARRERMEASIDASAAAPSRTARAQRLVDTRPPTMQLDLNRAEVQRREAATARLYREDARP